MAEASTEIALASFFHPEARVWATRPTFRKICSQGKRIEALGQNILFYGPGDLKSRATWIHKSPEPESHRGQFLDSRSHIEGFLQVTVLKDFQTFHLWRTSTSARLEGLPLLLHLQTVAVRLLCLQVFPWWYFYCMSIFVVDYDDGDDDDSLPEDGGRFRQRCISFF